MISSNCRPIRSLSNFSKISEKWIYTHQFFYGPKLSKYLAGFRKNHKTQHTLLKMIETWRCLLSKGNKVGAMLMDLSKAFVTLKHNLCKLKAYDFDKNDLTFISSKAIFPIDIKEQNQVISLANGKKSQQECLKALSLVNIFYQWSFLLKLLHFATMQMAVTILCINQIKSANIVISRLRRDFAWLSEWFYENYMVRNADKCHFLTVSFNEPFSDFSFSDTTENVTDEKIVGIVIDNTLQMYAKRLTRISK